MKSPFPRVSLIALLLFPLAWWATASTTFRTRIKIISTGQTITVSVNGQTLTAPGELGHLQAVVIGAYATFSPSGCDSLSYGPVGAATQPIAVPKTFSFPFHLPLVNDWWVDRGPTQAEVFRHELNHEGPIELNGVFNGRSLGGVELILQGDRRISGFFRAGNLNNDIGITVANRTVVAQGMETFVRVDLPHLLHTLLGGITVALALVFIFGTVAWLFPWSRSRPVPRHVWTLLAGLVIAAGFVVVLWTARSVLGERPHFQDDLGYLLRAKWLVSGHLAQPEPANRDHFSIPFTFFSNGKWIVQYPVGWSALLALGEAVHSAWIIGPLCALALGFLTWQLGKECGGPSAGVIAAWLGALSPLAVLLGGSMLSHTAAEMWEALFLWLYLRGWDSPRHGPRWLALAGLALGFAFTTRPLPPVAIALAGGVYGLVEMARLRFRREAWLKLAAIIGGGIVGALPQFLDNALVAGNPLVFAYSLIGTVHWTFLNFPENIFWADRTLAQVPGSAFGWGWPVFGGAPLILAMSMAFAAVPFLSGRANRKDWLLLGAAVAVPLSYMGHGGGSSLHGYGPRYYADVFFILFVLSGRGFQVLSELGGGSFITRGLATCLLLFLTVPAAMKLPERLKLYRSYNEVDDRVDRILDKSHVTRGLVLLRGPLYLQWIRLAPRLPADLKAGLVFAEDRQNNEALIKSYPGYPVYYLDEREARLAPESPPVR